MNKKAEAMFVQAEKDYIELLDKRRIVEVHLYGLDNMMKCSLHLLIFGSLSIVVQVHL